MQESKYNKPYQGTTGSPKGAIMVPNNLNGYSTLRSLTRGDGVVVVRKLVGRTTVQNRGIKHFSSKAGLLKQMKRGSDQKNIPEPNFNNVNIKKIANLKNLILAYETIKSKPGNMTPGIDNITLDGIDLKYFKNIQVRLKQGIYRFPPARRIEIPKAGKSKTRILSIGSPRDKIVQKAIQQVMGAEYEKLFLECSHGFRPNKGTDTAMQYLEAKFQSVHYIIEADFSKAFDIIQHRKLLEIIKINCKCTKTLQLIKSSLTAGYMELGELHLNLEQGTPQGSILSPLLCNIYLHELDKYIEELKIIYNKGNHRKRNKEYEKLTNKLKYMRKKGTNISKGDEYTRIRKQMLNTPSMRQDDSYTRIYYVRYADDFIIGIEGNYQLTKKILEEVKNYIENSLYLKFNEDKTKLTKYTKFPVEFLGYKLMGPHLQGINKPIETIKPIRGKIITRRKKVRIRIAMNYDKVISKLELEGFIRKRVSPHNHKKLIYRGRFKGNLINFEHADILRYYNSKILGLYNYYNFVTNMKKLAYVC
jgi:group II intron reverse transcriptase/maturase